MADSATYPQTLYPPRTALEGAFQVVRHARIPQMPDVVLALRNELSKEEPDLGRAADLIAQDLAMTAQILKTINSPGFASRIKVTSIKQAVGLIGIKRLANLVTAEAFNRLLSDRREGTRLILDFVREQAWAMMALTALTSALEPEELYLFGMMQSAGSVIFADLNQDYVNEWAIHALTAPQLLVECERRLFKADHATVGFLLAGVWRLPEPLSLAIYHQHALSLPPPCEGQLCTLIALAQLARALIALRRGIEDNADLLDRRDWALHELAIPLDPWERFTARLLADGSAL
ncbi:HDOD domain-containing protein [Caldichromatium japonicum]|uniref:HDOD domain-containing protein n=1 Tax=Caldichromatium japonicum TaxID=2699430 RepID=A0A6G7VD08_9GAMM|nr:HDOD domain-containing protein [Caldichromatium japonicum]QIK37738.1 HDOD domain-containing protein [Caldichromatium japonicum]